MHTTSYVALAMSDYLPMPRMVLDSITRTQLQSEAHTVLYLLRGIHHEMTEMGVYSQNTNAALVRAEHLCRLIELYPHD